MQHRCFVQLCWLFNFFLSEKWHFAHLQIAFFFPVLQERREQERRHELRMTLYHNQHYYLMEMLGLDEIYAHLIGSRFQKFTISDFSELANQNISEKLPDEQLMGRVYLA